MRIRLIVNPIAGGGRAKKNLPNLLDILKNLNFDVDVRETKNIQDGIKQAEEGVREGYEMIVAVGGDGTVNEVINGMVGSDIPLGIIPLGTVNVFAEEIGLPRDLNNACLCLKEQNKKKIDLGKAGNRYFILCAGVGFDAYVVFDVEPQFKKIWGFMAYPLTASMKTLFNYKPCKMLIQIDDHSIKRKGYLVVIGNIKGYAGKGISVTPEALFNDGFLDVCIFKKKTRWDIIRYAIGVLFKRHIEFEDIEYFKAKTVKIETERPVLVHTDCEVIGVTPMEFCVVPNILNVIFPRLEAQ